MNKSSPSFLFVGPTKTGSTWLYSNLQKHPAVHMPGIKEISYFFYRQELGDRLSWGAIFFAKHWLKDRHRSLLKRRLAMHKKAIRDRKWNMQAFLWDMKYLFGRQTDRWYLSLFDKKLLAGDISPMYSRLNTYSVAYVKKVLPQARIIIGLRDPIDRAWSHTRMTFHENFPAAPIDFFETQEALQFVNRVNTHWENDYVNLLQKWKKHYDPSQIFLYYYEELRENPQLLFDRICDFLELEKMPIPELKNTVNEGHKHELPPSIKALFLEKNLGFLDKMIPFFDSPYPRMWKEKYS